MTRSDAIITLKVMKSNCPNYIRDYRALELAIASLETDDYIEHMSSDVKTYTKADLDELIKRIERLDPNHYNSAEIKWLIIKMIEEVVDEVN